MKAGAMADRRAPAGLLAIALLLAPWAAQAADYRQAAGSTLAFAGEYDGEVFAGRFAEFDTTLHFDPAHPGSARLDVVVPLASVDTDNRDRDETLRDAAFFAVSRFPAARFTAAGFVPQADGGFLAHGTLELRGVAAPVTLRLAWRPGPRPVLEARASVSRTRFGVGGGDWADTTLLPDAIAVSARVVLDPLPPGAD